MDDRKALTKRELIKQISDETNLKTEVVKSVIDAFTDIFIVETVTKGHFHLSNAFTVKPIVRKERTQYNVHKERYERYPETEVLSITLSRKIHNYHRWAQRHQYNEENGLSVEDWRDREDTDELPEN